MTSTTPQSPSLHHLISSRTKFIEAVEEAINPPKNFDWVTTWLCVRSYQELDPAFSDLLVVRHAFKFLRLVHTTATLPSWWRSDFSNLMTPFVDAQRALVRNKGPNHTKVAHKLRKIGLLDETTDVGTAAGEAGSSKVAGPTRAQEQPPQHPAPSSATSVVYKRHPVSPQPDSSAHAEQKGKRKARDADIEEDELVNDDDKDEEIVILGHRKPKRARVYQPVSSYHYYRGNERCGNCVKSNTFPCKVPISATKCFMSCERCRRKKTKCDRPFSSQASPAKEKGKERASTSGQRQMNKTVQQAVLTVCDRLDAAIAQRISQVQAQVQVTAEWVNAQAQEPQGSEREQGGSGAARPVASGSGSGSRSNNTTKPAAQTDPTANKRSDGHSTTQASRDTRPTVFDGPRPRALFPPTTSVPATTSGNTTNVSAQNASKSSTTGNEGRLPTSTEASTARAPGNMPAPSVRPAGPQPSRSAQPSSSATSTSTALPSKAFNSNSTSNTNATVAVAAASKRSSQVTTPSNSTLPAPTSRPASNPPQISTSTSATIATTNPTNNPNMQIESTSTKDSDPIKRYFHLATRYAELQSRHAEITAELVKTYEEMVGVVDGERERSEGERIDRDTRQQWELPDAFKPDRLIDFSTGGGGVDGGAGKGKERDVDAGRSKYSFAVDALLCGSEVFRRGHGELWDGLVGRRDSGER